MAGAVAEDASEQAGDVVASVVESAVAQVEGVLEAAEARADAADALNETIIESARRDALHDEIEDLKEEIIEWREDQGGLVMTLQNQVTTLEARLGELQSQMMELANRSTVTTVSIQPPSETPLPTTKPVVTVTTVDPDSAEDAPMPESRAAPENHRRWI